MLALVNADEALAQEQIEIGARLGEQINATATELTRAFVAGDVAMVERTGSLEASFRSGAFKAAEFDPAYPLDQNWINSLALPNAAFRRTGVSIGAAYDNASCLIAVASARRVEAFSVATWPVDTTRRYRVSARLGAYLTGTSGTLGSLCYIGVVCLDGAGQVLDHGSMGVYRYSLIAGERIPDGDIGMRSAVMTGKGSDSWLKFAPGTKQVRICLFLNYQADSPVSTIIDYVRFEDAEGERAASDARARADQALTAIADGRFAAAQRVTELEAQVNFAIDSGLQRTINSRIEERASAIADVKAGAVAELVQTLRADYNGTAASVTQQAGAIVDLQGKATAYVRIVADAGNGRAALSLWSDQYGGAWSLTGDGQIDGNLTVNGTITVRKFDRTSMSREGTSVFSGSITPGTGQTVALPWSLALTQIPPVGRFIHEYFASVTTNAGLRTTTTLNGRPFFTDYLSDGGLTVSAVDAQGNVYSARPNSSQTVLATTDFVPSWTATVRHGGFDSGIVDQGDYYQRQISTTHTVTAINLKVTWVAI